MRPASTRLRFISAKKPEDIERFLSKLKFRVQIYSINWDGKKWFCWFVPPDDISYDVRSTTL